MLIHYTCGRGIGSEKALKHFTTCELQSARQHFPSSSWIDYCRWMRVYPSVHERLPSQATFKLRWAWGNCLLRSTSRATSVSRYNSSVHIGNSTLWIIYKSPGVLWLSLIRPQVFYHIITSTVHLHDAIFDRSISSGGISVCLATHTRLANNLNGCVEACNATSSAFPDQVIDASSPSYANFTASYWARRQQLATPGCVFSLHDAVQVSQDLKAVTDAQCHLSVKSGGHGPFAGVSFNNDEDGPLLLLSLFLGYDSEEKDARLGQFIRNVIDKVNTEVLARGDDVGFQYIN